MTNRNAPSNENDRDSLYPRHTDYARPGAAAPGKSTLTSRLPARPTEIRIDRHVSGSGAIGAGAGDALSEARGGAGGSLDSAMQGSLEAALGVDLSGVGVHTDAAAGVAADSIGANAYAEGQDIYFGAGAYDPGSQSGQRLIAHEVAHTVQQRGSSSGVQASKSVSQPGDAHEVEADAFADAFVAGGTSPLTSSAPSSIAHRDAKDDSGKESDEDFGKLSYDEQKRKFRKSDAAGRAALLEHVDSKKQKKLFNTLGDQDRLWLLNHVSKGKRRNLVRSMTPHEVSRLFYSGLGVAPAIIVYRAVGRDQRFEFLDGIIGVIGQVFTALRTRERSEMLVAASGRALLVIAQSVSTHVLVHTWSDLSPAARVNLFDLLPADKQDAVAMAFQTEDERQ